MKRYCLKKIVTLVGALFFAVSSAIAADKQVSVKSPDGTIEMTIRTQGR